MSVLVVLSAVSNDSDLGDGPFHFSPGRHRRTDWQSHGGAAMDVGDAIGVMVVVFLWVLFAGAVTAAAIGWAEWHEVAVSAVGPTALTFIVWWEIKTHDR